jgi:integrase/recombinase XerD
MLSRPTEELEIEAGVSTIAKGLNNDILNGLRCISKENASTIVNYISAMITETNPSDNYRKDTIRLLYSFSKYTKDKHFRSITREEVISFLNARRRPESSDPLHKWIGTYNLYLMYLTRFFKWLYFPNNEQSKRPKPKVVNNIPALRRKEKSIYKPSDLWTEEDDFIFFKYCPSKRDKCFHAMSWDTGCRPHELLKLRIKDISFKIFEEKQYAEVFVNGKTGTRHIPLIESIPYLKDYLCNEHPQAGNPNAILLCAYGKSINKALKSLSLNSIYKNYKINFFTGLLKDPNVPQDDKQKIQELLKKPWNPYIRRHSALTSKSKILKEHTLRLYAGWTANSNVPQRYINYFGDEASESLLQAYGIIPARGQLNNVLKSKQCPNCNEPNKPDAKFCAKCRMVLTYDAYNETAEEYVRKENELQSVKERMENIEKLLITIQPILRNVKPEMLDKLQIVVKD